VRFEQTLLWSDGSIDDRPMASSGRTPASLRSGKNAMTTNVQSETRAGRSIRWLYAALLIVIGLSLAAGGCE
jgi:hypothetical protein